MTIGPTKVTVLGMPLERWQFQSCCADFGVGDDWATLYAIRSEDQGRGHATRLLLDTKEYYENHGRRFGGSVALNDRMRAIYKRLQIVEYAE